MRGLLAIGLLLGWGVAVRGADLEPEELRRVLAHSPLPPPPADETNAVADDPDAARLGQRLFFETRLSAGARFSCASCHDPRRSFSDGRPVFEATARGTRHTPALWNVAYNRWLFWDGRADSLWSQALKPIEAPTEMAGSRLASVRLLASDLGLRSGYEAVFGGLPDVSDPARFPAAGGPLATGPPRDAWEAMAEGDRGAINRAFANIGKAVEAYERRLVSRRAPFDVFVEGLREADPVKQAALSAAALRGLKLFVGRGNCRVCHAGPNFSDGEFHDVDLPLSAGAGAVDPGRYAGIALLQRDEFGAAGAYSDGRRSPRAQGTEFLYATLHNLGQFKTPSLRNVALTPPYTHRGQLATLQDVLEHYSTVDPPPGSNAAEERILRPLHLSDRERADLVAFLESLTDTSVDPALLRPPDREEGR